MHKHATMLVMGGGGGRGDPTPLVSDLHAVDFLKLLHECRAASPQPHPRKYTGA